MDSLGDAYDQITVLFECFLQILKKDILIKSNFRKIDKQRIVSIVFAGQCTGGSQPSGMRPMISMSVTDFFSYTLASVVISRTVEATYFAALPKPGV